MQPAKFKPELVAPCGMNCNVCSRYLAYTRGVPTKKGKISHCIGCRTHKSECYIKRGCKKLAKNQLSSCHECLDMPCKNLMHLAKRYTERYNANLIGNLQEIKEKGIEQFLQTQQLRFRCPNCGDVLSVHDRKCYACGKKAPFPP